MIARRFSSAALFALLLFSTFCESCRSPLPTSTGAAQSVFDALTSKEILASVELLRSAAKLGSGRRISTLYLHEPSKATVLARQRPSRQAFAIVYDPARDETFEAVLDLTARKLISWTQKPGVQPPITGEDNALADSIVRSDGRWQHAMRRRGILLTDNVVNVSWPAGYFGIPQEDRGRLVRVVSYYRGRSNNLIARPIEGVVADVNLTVRTILRFADSDGAPLSPDTGAYSSSRQPRRTVPSGQARPQTPVRMVDGEVVWNRWRFHFAPHPREGLVLHRIRFLDHGRERPILYRASLAEMVVPYGDAGPAWFFRNTLDEGELGLGGSLLPFTPGADCPAEAQLFDAVFADERGQPRVQEHAIALFERATGVAWLHDPDFDPGRELVLKFFANLGNYDYGFEWIFRLDGSIEVRALLTGIMSVKGVSDTAAHDPNANHSGHKVAPNLVAVHHQHFFCFRLDFDIDGDAPNSVVEMDTQPIPRGKTNPYGNAFASHESLLQSEQTAQRRTDEKLARRWKIVNPSVKNAVGDPTGYVLLPGENSVPYAAEDSSIRRRAGFLNAHLWVTPYRSDESYPAGDYPNQSRGGEGLPHWTAGNREIVGQDVVLWYTLGITHLPRPEDWPVMPVYEAGFKLLPAGFFGRNPVLEAR